MEDSIFTKIIKREIPSEIVYEDDKVIAFLDIKPINPGHTLVVSKTQVDNFMDNSIDDLARVMEVGQKVGKALMKLEGVTGINFSTNAGESAGQIIFHTHFHVIPRHDKDGFKTWGHGEYKSGNEMREFADKLRDLLMVPELYEDQHPTTSV